LLNDQWVIDEIKEEIKRFLEYSENENQPAITPMGHSKGSPRGKIIAMSAYIKRTE
jgi:hypothetical protein